MQEGFAGLSVPGLLASIYTPSGALFSMFFESAFELHDGRMLSPEQLSKKLHHTIVGSFVSSEEREKLQSHLLPSHEGLECKHRPKFELLMHVNCVYHDYKSMVLDAGRQYSHVDEVHLVRNSNSPTTACSQVPHSFPSLANCLYIRQHFDIPAAAPAGRPRYSSHPLCSRIRSPCL